MKTSDLNLNVRDIPPIIWFLNSNPTCILVIKSHIAYMNDINFEMLECQADFGIPRGEMRSWTPWSFEGISILLQGWWNDTPRVDKAGDIAMLVVGGFGGAEGVLAGLGIHALGAPLRQQVASLATGSTASQVFRSMGKLRGMTLETVERILQQHGFAFRKTTAGGYRHYVGPGPKKERVEFWIRDNGQIVRSEVRRERGTVRYNHRGKVTQNHKGGEYIHWSP